MLTWFQHSQLQKPQHQLHPHVWSKFEQKQEFVEPEDNTTCLDKHRTKFIQEITGKFLFYTRAVDGTVLTALSMITSKQATLTEKILKKIKCFLDCAATHPNVIIMYRANDMILATHSNASYLSEPKAQSQAGGHFFMSANTAFPPNNGAVHNTTQILKQFVSLTAEVELGALFINSKLAMQL